jgi:hypothetical protein
MIDNNSNKILHKNLKIILAKLDFKKYQKKMENDFILYLIYLNYKEYLHIIKY